jgi:hypothetical protein
VGREQVAGREQALAEVAGYYFFFVADGGQVDAGVPVEKYIDVRRYIFELSGGEDSRFLTGPSARFGMTRLSGGGYEGLEQFGDAGRVHEFLIVARV